VTITTIRFRKPIKKKMCAPTQVSHATRPLMWSLRMYTTARERPIVAIVPLSK